MPISLFDQDSVTPPRFSLAHFQPLALISKRITCSLLPHLIVQSDRRKKIIYKGMSLAPNRHHFFHTLLPFQLHRVKMATHTHTHSQALQGAEEGKGGRVKQKLSSPESKMCSSALNLHFISCTDCHLPSV